VSKIYLSIVLTRINKPGFLSQGSQAYLFFSLLYTIFINSLDCVFISLNREAGTDEVAVAVDVVDVGNGRSKLATNPSK